MDAWINTSFEEMKLCQAVLQVECTMEINVCLCVCVWWICTFYSLNLISFHRLICRFFSLSLYIKFVLVVIFFCCIVIVAWLRAILWWDSESTLLTITLYISLTLFTTFIWYLFSFVFFPSEIHWCIISVEKQNTIMRSITLLKISVQIFWHSFEREQKLAIEIDFVMAMSRNDFKA